MAATDVSRDLVNYLVTHEKGLYLCENDILHMYSYICILEGAFQSGYSIIKSINICRNLYSRVVENMLFFSVGREDEVQTLRRVGGLFK